MPEKCCCLHEDNILFGLMAGLRQKQNSATIFFARHQSPLTGWTMYYCNGPTRNQRAATETFPIFGVAQGQWFKFGPDSPRPDPVHSRKGRNSVGMSPLSYDSSIRESMTGPLAGLAIFGLIACVGNDFHPAARGCVAFESFFASSSRTSSASLLRDLTCFSNFLPCMP